MNFRYIATDCNKAKGRFVGPVALLDHAKELLPELRSIPTFSTEWRKWVDLLDGSDALKPVLRWRIPTPVLIRLWAEYDECEPQGEASVIKEAEGAQILHSFGYALSRWGKDQQTSELHPLDSASNGTEMFIEDATLVAWTTSTYSSIEITRPGRDQPCPDDHGCVPLFRQWQALHLIELFLSENRNFAGIDRVKLAEQWPDLAPGKTTWKPRADTKGFDTHRAALEALSWHATYVQHALDLAQTSAPNYGIFATANGRTPTDDGRFVIQGSALQDLHKEETRIAREALDRHGVSETALMAAATWSGNSAKRRRDAGHANASRAYAKVMLEAAELLINLGYTLDQVKQNMEDGTELFDLFYPVWSKKAGDDLKLQILSCATDLNKWSDPSFQVFDEALADDMIEWLANKGLFAAHFSVPALMEIGHRPERRADVAVAAHLANLAAWLEHVCNELQDPNQKTSPTTLEQKIPGCWKAAALKGSFDKAWGRRCIPKTFTKLDDRVNHLLQSPATCKVDFVALQARIAQQIRNESMHKGLADLPRGEVHHAACIVLRTAIAVWLVGR